MTTLLDAHEHEHFIESLPLDPDIWNEVENVIGKSKQPSRAIVVERDGETIVVVLIDESDPFTVPEIRKNTDLTPREAEVAVLLAQRKSSHEIARALEFTIHSARRHTEQVLLKLGIHSRRDVGDALSARLGRADS